MHTLGAYVIHGNNVDTLEAALTGLRSISDHLVTVDSGSTDGSHDIALKIADRVEVLPWQGYGAARARAWELLSAVGVDWMFYLDSDEVLPCAQAKNLAELVHHARLKDQAYRVACRNLDLTGPKPYVFYTHHRVRLFRASASPWRSSQIVHEAFPVGRYARVDVSIDHRFLVNDGTRSRKERQYALLWAIQHADTRKARSPMGAWLIHAGRDLLGRGALFRGGLRAMRSAALLAQYARLKYQYLREVKTGGHSDLMDLYRRGALVELFQRVTRLT